MTNIDFNSADTQDSAFALIPANTLAKVYLTIRPGGAGPEGWLTQSKTSEALYLNTEAVIEDGPHARRRIYTRIGFRGRNGSDGGEDTYANRGRALIRGILESARGVRADDTSDRARAAQAVTDIAESSAIVDLSPDRVTIPVLPAPDTDVHIRWPDSRTVQEQRLYEVKLPLAKAFAAKSGINRVTSAWSSSWNPSAP